MLFCDVQPRNMHIEIHQMFWNSNKWTARQMDTQTWPDMADGMLSFMEFQ
jgi:hypothetical protein